MMPATDKATAAAARSAALADRHARWISALETERHGYVLRGLDDRVAQVDAELAKARKALAAAEPAEEPVDAPAPRKRRGPAKVTVQGPED